MSLLSGSMALRRYKVLGDAVPTDWRESYEKAIRAHALVPIDPSRNEDRSVGWASIHDEQDTDLNFAKFWVDGKIVLSVRTDTLKPPAGEVKRLIGQRQRELEAERQAPLSAGALRDLKAIIVVELRKSTPAKTATVSMVWDIEGQRVYLTSHSKNQNESFLRLFASTFNRAVDIEGPGEWARVLSEPDRTKELRNARPTVELLAGFTGLRPCVGSDLNVGWAAPQGDSEDEPTPQDDLAASLTDRRFLGREFLTWLIYRADSQSESDEDMGGRFPESEICDGFRVMIGERVILKALGDGSGEITARGAATGQSADVRFAVAGGLTVRQCEVLFARGDRIWMAAVNADGFDLRKVKLPVLLSEEDSERFHERLELIAELDAMLKASYAAFLLVRLCLDWERKEVPALREWLKRSIDVEATK